MLKSIKIYNYILVKEIEIDLSAGLNIFSGETGAGKSVIVEAINTVLGGNVRSGMVFQEKEPARIEVCFSIDEKNQALMDLITEYDLDSEEKELYFTKIISPSLKATTYLNGIRSTNTVIRQFRDVLIDFHSQRDQQRLFDNDYQLEIIDAFGKHRNELNEFQEKYKIYSQNFKLLEKLLHLEKENRDKFDLYSYQLEEIENTDLHTGEDAELNEEYNLLTHSEELLELHENFNQECFETENSIFDRINYYLSRMNSFENDSINIKNAISNMLDCIANLETANEQLIELKSSIDLDPQRLQDVSDRLDSLNSLKMKYNRSLNDIIAYSSNIREFIENFSSDQEKIIQLRQELTDNLEVLKTSAEILSETRKKTARRFADIIQENIKMLAMPAAQVKVEFFNLITNESEYFKQLRISGKDQVEIYFTANLGIDLQPLKVSASGGELSRFLLAIKKILAQYLHSKTIIFDEIDSGIGGRTAEYTGEFINTIAEHHQVICITHLAQIATFADYHFMIEKLADDNKSYITVKKLDNKDKVHEIARMLSGSDSNLALDHAGELLKKTGKDRCSD